MQLFAVHMQTGGNYEQKKKDYYRVGCLFCCCAYNYFISFFNCWKF